MPLLTAEALEARIEDLLQEEGFRAARVVERYVPNPDGTKLGLAATVPAVAWHVLRTLTAAERLSCLAWAWGVGLVIWWLRGVPTASAGQRSNRPAE